MPSRDWKEILKEFEAPEPRGVYILGCFARYLTLYSQQVRALNLVAALWGDQRIQHGTEVAVIGAGAAGLTAAAAAALKGAKVTLFEELEGKMELQVNNRQRYLHPHIYDWPRIDVDSERAKLPVLDWTADYACNVSRQFEEGWKKIQAQVEKTKPQTWPVEEIFGARHIALTAIRLQVPGRPT